MGIRNIMSEVEVSDKAYPLASEELHKGIFDLVSNAVTNKQVKKGSNETIKVLNKGRAELVIIASDTDPIEIVLSIPILCEDKNVPYIWVKSRYALGRACGINRAVICAAIVTKEGSQLNTQLNKVRNEVEAALV